MKASPMAELKWPLNKYAVIFLKFFSIIVFGNMLRNILGTLGIHWEAKGIS
jgi:hypothetical protein